MLLSLYFQVVEDVKKRIDPGSNHQAAAAVKAALDSHLVSLTEAQAKNKKELEIEEKEQKKHTTSDDIHEGFESKYVPPPPAPPPVKGSTAKKATKTTESEVLNPASSSSPTLPSPQISGSANDEEDELPELTSGLLAFSRLPVHEHERSWKLIQHRCTSSSLASARSMIGMPSTQNNAYTKDCCYNIQINLDEMAYVFSSKSNSLAVRPLASNPVF